MNKQSHKSNDWYLHRDLSFLYHVFRSEMYREDDALAFEQSLQLVDLVKQHKGCKSQDHIQDYVNTLSVDELSNIIRVLTIRLDLSNIAEDQHRIRVLTQREQKVWPKPRAESVADAITILKESGYNADDVYEFIQNLTIELVKTAHPTEAKRRIIRQLIRRIRIGLDALENKSLTRRQRQQRIADVSNHIGSIWGSELIHLRKPTVDQEVRDNLFVYEALWQAVPEIYSDIRQAYRQTFPGKTLDVPKVISIGSWIGSDRDGNPFVNAGTIRNNFDLRHQLALDKHCELCHELMDYMCLSHKRHPVSPQLLKRLRKAMSRWPVLSDRCQSIEEEEVYLRWLVMIHFRLTARRSLTTDCCELPEGAYRGPDELIADLSLLRESLIGSGHQNLADESVQKWMDKVITFGFHMSRCDVRLNTNDLWSLMKQIAVQINVPRPDELSADDWVQWLKVSLSDDQMQAVRLADLDPTLREILEILDVLGALLKSPFANGLGVLVLSMFHHPADALALIWLIRFAAARSGDKKPVKTMPIAPLFETIQDLKQAPSMLKQLLKTPMYKRYQKHSGEPQMVMVGYSDSTKDGGFLAANGWLFHAQTGLARVAREAGIPLTIFHGRGGALGRGGGPTAQAILSQPANTVNGRLRMTEQGEVLAERYDDLRIGYRHLEQVTWATLLVSRHQDVNIKPEWLDMLSEAAGLSETKYKSLIQHKEFVRYFREATPIQVIEDLRVGSRPSHRTTQRSLSSLRAIPFTFAWTQSRHMITAFFGLGTGLLNLSGEQIDVLREMYKNWPFFKGILDNAQLALIKFDADIVGLYAQLVSSSQEITDMARVIIDEARLSEQVLLKITEQQHLLERSEWLRQSVERRDPMVHALNFIQIELLKRLKVNDRRSSQRLEDALRLSVHGLAAGLRSTG
jgi:phosphoenolpyruvate carboxylase